MFVFVDLSGDGNGGIKLYVYNLNNNWVFYVGYLKILFGVIKKGDGIVWNFVMVDFYI